MMVANVAYSAYSNQNVEQTVIDKGNQAGSQTAHKVFNDGDAGNLESDSLNVQDLGRNHLADTQDDNSSSSADGIAIPDDADYFIREVEG